MTAKRSNQPQLDVREVRPYRAGEAYFTCIEVKDRLVLVAGGAGKRILLASTDGVTFHRRLAVRANGLRGARVIGDAIWQTGEYGTIAVSKDRGASWTQRESNTQSCLWDIVRDTAGDMWIAGSEATLLRSRDNGKTWKPVKHTLKPRDDRADPRIELVGAGVFFALFGAYWNGKQLVKAKGIRGMLSSLAVSPGGTVVAVGDKGIGFRSTDGGVSFKPVTLGPSVDFDDVAYVAGGFVAIGDKGTMRRSIDDGETWKPLASDVKQHLWAIGSWGGGAFVGGDGGLLLRLDSKDDDYWTGATDDFAMAIDATGFVPPRAPSEEVLAARYAKLLDEALAAHTALTAKRTPPTVEDPAIHAEIVAHPDDANGYLVYADVLQSRGDPRGELIVAQQREDAAAKDMFKRARKQLLGKLADVSDLVKLEWRWGFIRTARVANSYERDPDRDGTKPAIDIVDVLGWLLDEPSARYLRELTVGIVTFEDNSYGRVIDAIAKRSLPVLRKLFLGDFESEETELNWSSIGDASRLCAAVPNLEELVLRSGSMKLGALVLPRLRVLEIITGGFDKGSMKSVIDAHMPALEKLSLELGSERYDATVKLKHVLPLLSSERFPRLQHLGLANSELSDQLCQHLPFAPIVAQLRELDLCNGVMSDDGARMLAAHAKAFTHLDALGVENNFITPATAKLLKKAIPGAQLAASRSVAQFNGGQRDDHGDPEDRYIAAGE